MNPFKHFILTRFNLGIYDSKGDYHVKVGDPEQWMEHRIELFERYCLPSVMSQTCKNFTWVLAFDPQTPCEIICQYDYMDNIQVIFEKPQIWLKTVAPECEWLITSRFDNDDMYAPDFVEKIHEQFEYCTEIIDIDYHAWDLNTNTTWTSGRKAANSPFLTLVEVWEDDVMTALGEEHSIMPNFYMTKKLGVYATQIIHNRNISNQIRGALII
jgi:hypothetical protein